MEEKNIIRVSTNNPLSANDYLRLLHIWYLRTHAMIKENLDSIKDLRFLRVTSVEEEGYTFSFENSNKDIVTISIGKKAKMADIANYSHNQGLINILSIICNFYDTEIKDIVAEDEKSQTIIKMPSHLLEGVINGNPGYVIVYANKANHNSTYLYDLAFDRLYLVNPIDHVAYFDFPIPPTDRAYLGLTPLYSFDQVPDPIKEACEPFATKSYQRDFNPVLGCSKCVMNIDAQDAEYHPTKRVRAKNH